MNLVVIPFNKINQFNKSPNYRLILQHSNFIQRIVGNYQNPLQIMTQQTLNPQSLLQLLTIQLNTSSLDYYALSLVHSRNQSPTPEILHLLKVLSTNNSKWLEVVRRLADQSTESYVLVSQTCSHDFMMYRAFINNSFMRKDQSMINVFKMSILDILEGNNPNFIGSDVVFQTLEMLLLEASDYDLQFFVPFFSPQIAAYLNHNLGASKHIANCLIILIDKFMKFEKKNMFKPNFKQNFLQFDRMIENIFKLCIEVANPVTFEILALLTQKTSLYDQFIANASVLLQLCQNTFKEFNVEMNLKFQSDFEQMINYEDDLINSQLSKTVYTEAAAFFQKMVSNTDGMLTSLFHRNLQLIQKNLTNTTDPNSKQMLELMYLQLLIITKSIKQRSDLQEEFTEFLGDNFQNIFSMQPHNLLTNSRLVLIIQQYIFWFPLNYLQETLLFLFRGIELPFDGFVLRLYSTLRNIMNQKQLYSAIRDSIQNLSSRLIMFLESASSYHYFELFETIMHNFDDITDKYFYKILSELTKRLHIEVKTVHSKGIGTNQIIRQIYRCIKVMFLKPYLLDELYDSIEPILNEHTKYLENPTQIDFEQNILDMAALVIQKGKTFTPFVMLCLKSVRGIYEKSKDLDNLFELFYSLCTFASDYIFQNPKSAIFMVDIIVDYFKYEVQESMFYTAAYNRACLLLQLVVQHLEPLFIEGQMRDNLISVLLIILQNMKQSPPVQFTNILISLYYIAPFNFELPKQQLNINNFYNAKLRSLYHIAKLKCFYSQQNLSKALDFYQRYIDSFLSKKTEINPNTGNEYIDDADEEKFMKGLDIPLRKLDDLIMIEHLIKELKSKNMIDARQLTDWQNNTLKTLTKVMWVGKEIRKAYKLPTLNE